MASDDAKFCHLCGSTENLSFEHIPPRRCFNDSPARLIELSGLSIQKPVPPHRKYHRGMGRKSLCVACNCFTGDKYGEAYFDWTIQAARYAARVGYENCVSLPFRIRPLNVLKQIATMAIAAADPSPAEFHRRLRHFIRTPYEQGAVNNLAFYAYLNPARQEFQAYANNEQRSVLPQTRMTGTCGMLDVTGRPMLQVFVEIAFPPFGYLVAFRESNSPTPDQVRDMPDLQYFCRYGWQKSADLDVRLPVRTPIGPSPGHYVQR